MILLRKNMGYQCQDKEVDRDREGRRVSVILRNDYFNIKLTNIYAPNSPTKDYFQKLATWYMGDLHERHKVAGDFNTTMDDGEDRLHRPPATNVPKTTRVTKGTQGDTALHTFAGATQLTDFWRQLYPTHREYTYFSQVHSTFSRIDYMLGSPDTLALIDDVQIQEIVISDHAPIIVDVRDVGQPTNFIPWRFPSQLVNNKDFKAFLIQE